MFSKIIIIVAALAYSSDLSTATALGRIVGGTQVSITLRPFQVFIQTGGKLCGGSILNQYWILTAGHCTHNIAVTNILVAAGVQDIRNAKEGQVRRVAKVINHPNYDDVELANDITMLKLYRPLTYSSSIKRIEIFKTVPPSGSILTASGYGALYTSGPVSYVLMSVDLKLSRFDECNRYWGNSLIPGKVICAVGWNKDVCQGDSGGPITYQGKLLGVVSFGNGCANNNAHGVYTSAPGYLDWINQNMARN